MRTLVIDSATEACSVALFADDEMAAGEYAVIGRGHAERLVPMIARLPDRGRAECINVSIGPGSFTGVRIGLAAAKALGLAWGAEVRGYPTLALIAAMAQARDRGPVTVCTTGGHGEWFVQNFAASGLPEDNVRSMLPDAAASARLHPMLAGDKAPELADLVGCASAEVIPLLPDARAFRLPDALLAANPSPLYGRAPDARLPA